jgi:hypothetical protein
MKSLLSLLVMFCGVPVMAATVHVDYHSSTVQHQNLGGSYAAGDQVGEPKLLKAIGPRGGTVILESIVALDENETTPATIHHFFESAPSVGVDSAAINFTGSETKYLGSATGGVLVDVGDYSVANTSFGATSTVVLKLKNNSTGITVIHEAVGTPGYTTGKTRFKYYFKNQ